MADRQAPITDWNDVERWLRQEARECVRDRALPSSIAFAFHGGALSAVIETPMFCEEDADLITDELCRFLPQLQADQLLVIWPGAYPDRGDHTRLLCVLKAHLGERDHGWRTLLHPLPFDHPDLVLDPVEIDPPDPWSQRIRELFDVQVPPIHDHAIATPADSRFTVAIAPDGIYRDATTMFSYN